MDFELNLCDVQPGVLGGAKEEFVFVGRLDNLGSCYTALEVSGSLQLHTWWWFRAKAVLEELQDSCTLLEVHLCKTCGHIVTISVCVYLSLGTNARHASCSVYLLSPAGYLDSATAGPDAACNVSCSNTLLLSQIDCAHLSRSGRCLRSANSYLGLPHHPHNLWHRQAMTTY